MGSFTNHRSIEEVTLAIFKHDGPLPQIDAFYRDIHRVSLSVDGVPCLAPNEILIPGANQDINEEKNQGVKSSKALFDYIFKKYNISPLKKKYYENFIKLFLNQLYYGIPPMTCSSQLIGDDINSGLTNFNVDLNLNENNLYLTISYSFFKQNFESDDHEKNIILKGKTIFKIEVNPQDEKGWIAKFGLVDSTIDCKDEYKHILDTRNFLEKLLDFFTSIIKRVTTDTHSDALLKSKIKSTPLFFVSKDGESMESPIVNPSKELFKKTY